MTAAAQARSIQLSIILPSFNSASLLPLRIPELKRYLGTLHVSHEIIVVDDGSNDGGRTKAIASEIGVTCLVHPRNRGKGAAVRTGMRAAKGQFRIFTDIDIPYAFESINKILYYLNFKEYHMVVGDRTLQQSSYYKHVPVIRSLTSFLFSGLVGHFVAGGWYDTQCGIKGFRDDVAEDLFGVACIDRFAFDVELFYIALKRNYDIKRIAVKLEYNETSTVNVIKDGFAMLRDVGIIRLNQLRGKYLPIFHTSLHAESQNVDESH